jgi:hypothetical protein
MRDGIRVRLPSAGRIGRSGVCDARKAVSPIIGADWCQLRSCHRKPPAIGIPIAGGVSVRLETGDNHVTVPVPPGIRMVDAPPVAVRRKDRLLWRVRGAEGGCSSI